MLASRRGRLARTVRAVRRAVLVRRRSLAALLTAVAVVAGLRATAAPPPPTVPVVVAAADLPAGAVVSAEDVTTAAFPPGTVPSGAAEPVGRVLAAPVRAGEVLTDVRLVGPRLTLERPDLTAVPVRLPDAGMAALLEVGDRVDVLAADPRGGGASTVARGVLVLALPLDEEPAVGGNGLTGRLVVLGASAEEVPVLAQAATTAFLSFAWSG